MNLNQYLNLNTLLFLAVMIFAGMFLGRMAKHIRLPNVTGYIVAGLILGPSVLGIVPEEVIKSFEIISTVSLGFIAFSIGNEFKMSYFKRVGASPIIIAFLEAFFAVIFVFAALVCMGVDVAFALVLSSIAAATAPAATIMVIKQYRARGPVTESLLSVVAIDDAAALMLFSVCVAIAQTITKSGEGSLASTILSSLWEIFGAIIIGAVLGFIFLIPLRFFKKNGNRLSLIFGFIFLALGISKVLHVSDLMCCMAMGAIVANFSADVNKIMDLCDGVTPPMFMLFFVASGADLKLSVLPTVGIIGVLYIVFRVIGKISGAAFGGVISKAEPKVKKYLGWALIPQAGVAIGLSLAAGNVVPEYAPQIRAIILCATLIYELIGPVITKISLKKAGEIQE